MVTPLPITGRPVRLGVVGLGQIAELALPPYLGHDDVEVVGLCDLDPGRLARWADTFPLAVRTTKLDELLDLALDVVDVLVPTPNHAEVVCRVLEAGVHVQVQKPLARSREGADRMLAAADAAGAALRVMEDYLFYPPIVKLQEIVRSGEIGRPAGVHMKIVANGRGGWEVLPSSYVWQFEQIADGRGMLVFDHGWHQFAIAHALFGPIRRVYGWIGHTQVVPELDPHMTIDAPSTLVWEHHSGVRGVLDITYAPDMYFRSDFYTGDERVEVTGTEGFVRCNRISARGIQEPSVVVYREGERREQHALPDTPPDAFRASARHGIDFFRTGSGPPVMDSAAARHVLDAVLAAIESSDRERPVDVA